MDRNADMAGLMRAWAHWREGDEMHLGYSPINTIGRCIADMPSTRCTHCAGRGRVALGVEAITCPVCVGVGKIKLDHTIGTGKERRCSRCGGEGEISGAACFKCRGSGKVGGVTVQINPAFIPATDGGTDDDFDPRYLIVDSAVCRLKRLRSRLYDIIAHVYMRARAPRWWDERSRHRYLSMAHDEIQRAMDNGAYNYKVDTQYPISQTDS